MEGNANCKNSRFEPLFGDLGATYTVHLWLAVKRVVDLILVLIEFCSLALRALALLREICRNRRFLKDHFERKFLVDGDVARHPWHLWTVR